MGGNTIPTVCLTMLTTLIFTILAITVTTTQAMAGLGTIQRISILTSNCENCDMTLLGQINLKICGGSPEPCCSIVNIADFDSEMFNQGQIDNYVGDHQLEDCYNYKLDKISSADQLGLTVYHEGSDGGQLDWIEVTTDNITTRCPLGYWMDSFSSVTAEGCYAV